MKKNLTKIIMAAAACIALTAGTVKAQNGRFSVGAELALPMGNFKDAAGMGFGGSVRYEYPVSDNLGLTGTVGYLVFGKKSFNDGFVDVESTSSMIPVQAGLKYYFQESQNGFYAMAELGIHNFHSKVSTPSYTVLGFTFPASEVSGSSTNLSYAPELGYHLANIDLGVRYQIISTTGSTTSYLGLRFAYVFGEAK
jgi:hypothetical protein